MKISKKLFLAALFSLAAAPLWAGYESGQLKPHTHSSTSGGGGALTSPRLTGTLTASETSRMTVNIPSTYTTSLSWITYTNNKVWLATEVAAGLGSNFAFLNMGGAYNWGTHFHLVGSNNWGVPFGVHGSSNIGFVGVADSSSSMIGRIYASPTTPSSNQRIFEMIGNADWEAHVGSGTYTASGDFRGFWFHISSVTSGGSRLNIWNLDYRGVQSFYGPTGSDVFTMDTGRTLANHELFNYTGTTIAFLSASGYAFYAPGGASKLLEISSNGITINGTRVAVHRNADVNISSGTTPIIIPWDTEDIDTGGEMGTSTFTTVQNGLYRVDASVMSTNGATNSFVFLYKNGTAVARSENNATSSQNRFSYVISLAAGDKLDFRYQHTAVAVADVLGLVGGVIQSWASITKL